MTEEEILRATDRGLDDVSPTGLARLQAAVEEVARQRLRALFPEAATAAGL